MIDIPWIWALVAVGVGLLLGEIGGSVVRSLMGRSSRSPGTRERARSTASAVFWASVAVGMVVAAGILDSEELDDFGEVLGDGLPRLLLAGVLLIAGYALALVIAAAVGQSALRATGVRQVALERVLKVGVIAIAVVVALRTAGVDTSLLIVLFAGLVGAPALTVALLTAAGGRHVAAQLAAGRALRNQLEVGWRISVEDLRGTVVAMNTTFVEVEDDEGRVHHLPNRWLMERPFRAQAD